MNIAGQLLFDGFAMGLVYVILAVAWCSITSVNKILFMAYGMFYTLGAYITWSMLNYAHLPYAVDAILGALTAAVVGMASYVLIFQRLQKSKGGFSRHPHRLARPDAGAEPGRADHLGHEGHGASTQLFHGSWNVAGRQHDPPRSCS